MGLIDIALDTLLDCGYRSIGNCFILASAEDAAMTDLEKHDAKYHPDGYEEGDTCKYRDEMAKGDLADAAIDPENVEGEEVSRKQKAVKSGNPSTGKVSAPAAQQPSSEDRMKEIFREYRHNMMRSDKWLMKNLGIEDPIAKNKASGVLASFQMGQTDKHTALDKLIKLSSGLPKDAWKPGKSSGAKSSNSLGHFKQLLLPSLLGGSKYTLGSTNNLNPLSKYYHAQGNHQYTNELHKDTGLYKVSRPGGKALAREEDVPGMTPFHKHRPFFKETGKVPSSLSDADLAKFRYTSNGSTYPTVGNVGGRNYIVKHGVLPEGVRRNADLNDHLRTEVAADRFMREAGLNVPVCSMFERELPKPPKTAELDEKKLQDLYDRTMVYKLAKSQYEQLKADKNSDPKEVEDAKAIRDMLKDEFKKAKDKLGKKYETYKAELKKRIDSDGNLLPKKEKPTKEVVKIAEYVEGGVSLPLVWQHATKTEKDQIRQQVVDAYPVMSFLELVDDFKNDNILVDRDNRLWFVDNGASFDYRAQGGKKLLNKDGDRMSTSKDKTAKPWFYERQDPTDEITGYLGLAYAPDQKLLQDILSETSDQELVDAAKKYNFSKLVKTLPQELQKPGLVEYAKKLDDTVRNPPEGWLEERQ